MFHCVGQAMILVIVPGRGPVSGIRLPVSGCLLSGCNVRPALAVRFRIISGTSSASSQRRNPITRSSAYRVNRDCSRSSLRSRGYARTTRGSLLACSLGADRAGWPYAGSDGPFKGGADLVAQSQYGLSTNCTIGSFSPSLSIIPGARLESIN